VPPEQAEDWEAAAERQLPKLHARAQELRAEWLRQRDGEVREVYQRELLGWEAAKERAEAAAAAAAASAEEAAAVAAAAKAAAAAAAAAAVIPEPAAAATAAPRTVEAIKNEGNEHLKAKRYQQAEECYRECLRLDPDNVPVRLNLMVLLNATERWAEAEAGADKALAVRARDCDPRALPSSVARGCFQPWVTIDLFAVLGLVMDRYGMAQKYGSPAPPCGMARERANAS
jgi:tetratricopeptide (TPR) repeat protein